MTMSRHRDMALDCKVYVGDLPRDATEREIEKAFSHCGTIKKVWVARNPPGFAFVEFDDPRDADDAVRDLDGRNVCGARARVEHSSGKVRPKPWLRERGDRYSGDRGPRGGPPARARAFDPSDRCYQCGERGHYAYDCRRSGGGRRRSRSRSPGRRRSRSRSRSRGRYSRSRSRSRSYSRGRSRSRSRGKYSRSPTPKKRGHARSYSRSRSRSRGRRDSPVANGD